MNSLVMGPREWAMLVLLSVIIAFAALAASEILARRLRRRLAAVS